MDGSNYKWNAIQIVQFLDIYEQYEVLWNIRHQDYLNKNKRELLFEKLVTELRGKGFENVDVDIVRKKLKMIKTVYRQELEKIAKSRRSGAGTSDVYTPKLIWFGKADSFLRCVTATRKSTSTMGPGEETNPQERVGENTATTTNQPDLPRSPQSPQIMSPTTSGSKRMKTGLHLVNEAINNLERVMKNSGSGSSHSDEFQQFGIHVATQLRQLPLPNALKLQEKIQSLITRERISCITQVSPLHSVMHSSTTEDTSVTYISSPSTPSPSLSTSEASDVLHEAMIHDINDDEFIEYV